MDIRGKINIIIDHYQNNTQLLNYKSPQDLKKEIDVDLDNTNDDIDYIIKQILDNIVNTKTPYFCNQLFSTMDDVAVIGEILSTFINTSMYTYEVSTILTLMENEVIEKMGKLYWEDSNVDGMFCPGGSIGNLYAMIIARNNIHNCKNDGILNGKLVGFTSECSHYSIVKNANIIGIGTDNIIKIPCHDDGSMITEELDNAIQESINENCIPFFVCGTAGTTVTGSFDNFTNIHNIIQKYGNIHFHIDGGFGRKFYFFRSI